MGSSQQYISLSSRPTPTHSHCSHLSFAETHRPRAADDVFLMYAGITVSLSRWRKRAIFERRDARPWRYLNSSSLGYILTYRRRNQVNNRLQHVDVQWISSWRLMYGRHADYIEVLGLWLKTISDRDRRMDKQNGLRYILLCTLTMNGKLDFQIKNWVNSDWTDWNFLRIGCCECWEIRRSCLC